MGALLFTADQLATCPDLVGEGGSPASSVPAGQTPFLHGCPARLHFGLSRGGHLGEGEAVWKCRVMFVFLGLPQHPGSLSLSGLGHQPNWFLFLLARSRLCLINL